MTNNEKNPTAVELAIAEPEIRAVISVGTQGGGSAHQVIAQKKENLAKLLKEAEGHIKDIMKLPIIPTTDMDVEEITKALEGEPVSVSVKTEYRGKQEQFKFTAQPKEVLKKYKGLIKVIQSFVEYEDKKKAALDKL